MTEFAFALEWERLGNEGSDPALVTERARVFGGWLVRVGTSPASMALAFVPDGEGRWDGEDFGEEDYEYDEDAEEEEDEEEEDLDDDEDLDEEEDEDE
ncbi:DNA primase [Pseudoxanthomonas suwonensis]|jgi:AAA ATPase containing von Willebrand factor type A (vWA) domain|uniref:DNA primase n=1 Tax=Pseudoxanthomonas suwonensis TaxID=314722 RepID=UPI00138F8074|nr:DNA primase [Pseudoxanthomonas suwonensis]KAF1701127.1 DNA primase [Pseudoxanthomonas suwonensis]